MKRDEWAFSYSASELASAAAKKREHHKGRAAWWEDQKAAVMQEVKDSGIEVSESLATMVRTDLQRKLSECHMKINEHVEKAALYDGWAQVLNKNSSATLPLHSDDWLFFFRE